jgi:hypothetical protein
VNKVSSVFIHTGQNDFIEEESQESEGLPEEIIIEVPVEIEKEVIVVRQELVFVEVPV